MHDHKQEVVKTQRKYHFLKNCSNFIFAYELVFVFFSISETKKVSFSVLTLTIWKLKKIT